MAALEKLNLVSKYLRCNEEGQVGSFQKDLLGISYTTNPPRHVTRLAVMHLIFTCRISKLFLTSSHTSLVVFIQTSSVVERKKMLGLTILLLMIMVRIGDRFFFVSW